MYRVVFDTNIFLSAFIYGGNPAKVFELARKQEFQLLTSPGILAEFAKILSGKFAWTDSDVKEAILAIGYSSELIKPSRIIQIIKDEADNRILECAAEGNADFIVSGDHHLLDLGEFESIKIVRATDLLKHLRINSSK